LPKKPEKSLISSRDFSNLENDFLEMVISNLISKNPWGLHRPPLGVCVWVCVRGYVWGVGVGLRGVGLVRGMLWGHSKLGFEINFEITIFEITVFKITVFEVKPSSPKKYKHNL